MHSHPKISLRPSLMKIPCWHHGAADIISPLHDESETSISRVSNSVCFFFWRKLKRSQLWQDNVRKTIWHANTYATKYRYIIVPQNNSTFWITISKSLDCKYYSPHSRIIFKDFIYFTIKKVLVNKPAQLQCWYALFCQDCPTGRSLKEKNLCWQSSDSQSLQKPGERGKS